MNMKDSLFEYHWYIGIIAGILFLSGGIFASYGYLFLPFEAGFTLNEEYYSKGVPGYEESLNIILIVFGALAIIFYTISTYFFFIGIKDLFKKYKTKR